MKKNKKTVKKQMQRRDFLKTAAVVGAATTLPGCVSSVVKRNVSGDTSEKIYDFIIVGTGAGGAPLASRLALFGYSVLCIEAGFAHRDEEGKDPIEMRAPVYHTVSSEHPDWSWNFFVRHNGGKPNVLNSRNADLKDTKYEASKGGILYPRASGIGGCTTHNAMITVLPDNKDWQYLADQSRDKSWNPANMRNYYDKIKQRPKRVRGDRYENRGWLPENKAAIKFLLDDLLGNPLGKGIINNPFAKIFVANLLAWDLRDGIKFEEGEYSRVVTVVREWVAKNGPLLDYDTNGFEKGPKAEGIYRITTAIDDNGERSGPKEWLLETAKKTNNIDIVTGHLAAKIILKDDDDLKTAVGVECIVSRETNLYSASPRAEKYTTQEKKVYKARREVILAGGAFNTPQLLMLSGIGNESDLTSMDIQPQINLPMVGRNLQDRYEVGVVSELNEDYEALKDCTFDPAQDPCLEEYLKDPTNSLYSTNGALVGNLLRSRHSKKDEDPDLFIFALPGDFRGYKTGYSKESTKHKNRLTWAILKAKTTNTTGYVKLRSKDPTDTPEINFNNFTDGKEDLEAMVDGINFSRSINTTWPLKSLVKEEAWPAKSEDDEEKLKKFVANEAWGHHASCTCPMGRYSYDSVVNYDFKVHQTTNLRIVDASVFPKIPGHFIVAPIYMIAEKAAEVIRKDNPSS